MVKGGDNWQETWFGVMPETKVAIVMLSEAFFQSEACVDEMAAILKEPGLSKRVIPVFVSPIDMSKGSDFLGSSKSEKRQANFFRTKIDGNCIPPPDEGLFQDNWERNVELLSKRVGELMKKAKK